jgi:excisionase family DNA binding protein
MNQIEDRLLRQKEVAELLGVSKSTIVKLGKTGRLSPINITSRAVGYRMSDIKRFMETGSTVNTG